MDSRELPVYGYVVGGVKAVFGLRVLLSCLPGAVSSRNRGLDEFVLVHIRAPFYGQEW